jgi:hypothetical protein
MPKRDKRVYLKDILDVGQGSPLLEEINLLLETEMKNGDNTQDQIK